MKRTHLAKKMHPHFRRRVGNYDVVNTNLAKKLCENSDVRFSFCSVKVNYVKLIHADRKPFNDHGSNEVDAEQTTNEAFKSLDVAPTEICRLQGRLMIVKSSHQLMLMKVTKV